MKAFSRSLSRGWGFCLDDRPAKRDLMTPLARLGVRYTTHHQCQLQYGPDATFCPEVDVRILHVLKCNKGEVSCFTHLKLSTRERDHRLLFLIVIDDYDQPLCWS